MRNKFVAAGLFCSAILFLGSCHSQNDVSMEELAQDLTPLAFEKTETRSTTTVDGLSMTIVEWTIDAEKKQIAPSGFTYGDGVETDMPSQFFTYEQGDLREGGLGMNYIFTPVGGGESLPVIFWGNALIIKGDTIGDASAPIANLKKIGSTFPNTAWEFYEDEYAILYDTIQQVDTVITSVKRPDPVTGKPIVVKDTTYKTVTTILADTLGKTLERSIFYSFSRDAQTKVNTGMRTEHTIVREVNADKTGVELKSDDTTEQTFHWGVASMTSATRFVLNIKNDDAQEIESLSVAKLDVNKGTVEIKSKPYTAAQN